MKQYRKKPVVVEAIQWNGQYFNEVHLFDRKKPVVVEAIQWNGHNFNEVHLFAPQAEMHPLRVYCLQIPTLEGLMIADLDDWIIKGIKGEFYPCKPAIFEATYEEVPAT